MYSFLVEGAKIESTLVRYRIATSEANVKTNRMRRAKWTYHKERGFSSKYFIFKKILFQFKNLLQRVELLYQLPQCQYSNFPQAMEFYFN